LRWSWKLTDKFLIGLSPSTTNFPLEHKIKEKEIKSHHHHTALRPRIWVAINLTFQDLKIF